MYHIAEILQDVLGGIEDDRRGLCGGHRFVRRRLCRRVVVHQVFYAGAFWCDRVWMMMWPNIYCLIIRWVVVHQVYAGAFLLIY